MESLCNEFRWKIIKRKKQVVNLCAAFGFLISVTSAGNALAADAVSPDTLPTDPVTIEGSATHTYDGNDLNVGMGSSYVKDTYSSFNIGRDASVNINGGNTYVAKVLEGGGLSHIYGQINAGGVNVFLQNSSGITFHGSSQVNVGSLLATTASDILINSSDDYETIDSVKLSGYGDASVINEGKIKVSDGGFAVLAAPEVVNKGFIQADLGKIALIGSTVATTIDFRGDGLITYTLSDEAFLDEASVTNEGTLQARSGLIHIEAKAASDIVDSVVNLDGVIDADSFGDGHDGGAVLVKSSGDININDVNISANGGTNGNGGNVDTWADGVNYFNAEASIDISGGDEAGNGGVVEISGNQISFGGNIDAETPNGDNGTVIIDPIALTIKNGSGPISKNPILDTIYETTIETLSKLGANVVLKADYLVMLENLLDGVLEGGRGNITLGTLKNAGAVIFLDRNDKISTTSGDININAGIFGIDIGHLETGRGALGRAGNINLSTEVKGLPVGGNITTKSITVGGTTLLNKSNANSFVNIDAHGDVTVNGNINVTAASFGKGANANSKVDIASKNGDIKINGELNVTAFSKRADANSTIDISAAKGNVDVDDVNIQTGIVSLDMSAIKGNLTFGNIDINASNVDDSKKQVNLSSVNGNILGGNIDSDADINITTVDNTIFGLAGNVEIRKINTDNRNKKININADGNVTTRVLRGDVDIEADGGNINIRNVNTRSDVKLAATSGGLFNLGGNINTKNIRTRQSRGDISISADKDVNTGSLFGNVDINADGDVTTKNINSKSSVSIVADNIETNNVYVFSNKSGKNNDANASINMDAQGSVNVNGSLTSKASARRNSDAEAIININANDNIVITDNIETSSSSRNGDSDSSININSADGNINIQSSISSLASSINGDVSSDVIVQGKTGVLVEGNIWSSTDTVNGDADTSTEIVAPDGDIEVLGSIIAKAYSTNNNAIASLLLSSSGDIMLSDFVDDPLVMANGAILQQRQSGTLTTADGDASITFNAGGDVRFFDVNGFDQNGIHKETGTAFNPAGFDVNGYDVNGFDINGFNQFGFNASGIHRDTGTPYGPDGYDQNGFDIAGFDRDGYDINGFDAAGYDRNGYDIDGFDVNGFNVAGIHRDTGTIYDPNGFDVSGNPAPSQIDLLVSQIEGGDDGQSNTAGNNSGLSNLEPAAGGSDECEFMNCDESNS
jgi:filamentous hemagglutinin family protein